MITIHQITNIPNNGINSRLSRRSHVIQSTAAVTAPVANTPSAPANTHATMMFNESKSASATNKDTVSSFENRIKDLEDKLASLQSSIESSAQNTTVQSSRFRRR